jgi:hypothetical protein
VVIARINQRTLRRVYRIWRNESMLTLKRIVGTSSTFYELHFRFYSIIVLRSVRRVAQSVQCLATG